MRPLLLIPPFGIRVQLTLWYSVISAMLVFLFGVAFYTSLQASFAASMDTSLQMLSHEAAESISQFDGKITIRSIIRKLPEVDATAALIDTSQGQMSIPATKRDQDETGQSMASLQASSNIFGICVWGRSARRLSQNRRLHLQVVLLRPGVLPSSCAAGCY